MPKQHQASPDLGILFIVLYLLLHFIPNLGSVDVIGPQWLVLSLLNLLVTGFILVRRVHYEAALDRLFRIAIPFVFVLLLFWAGGSYFYAINRGEVLVNLARLVNTAIVFFNVAVLLWNKPSNFFAAAYVLTFILLYESMGVLTVFFNGLYTVPFDQLILDLKGNTGNKNIMAAALAIKLPFVLYTAFRKSNWLRIVALATLSLAMLSIAILNARTTYVSVLVASLLYVAFCLLVYFNSVDRSRKYLVSVLFVLFPLFFGFGTSQLIISNVQEVSGTGGYSTITDRVETIALNQEGSGGRLGFWKDGFDYARRHPILGCGIGNWKLVSIPYVRETTNELIVPYHAHNDFIEMTADLGFPGGLLFAALFVLLLLYVIKTWRSPVHDEIRFISLFSLIGLSVYFFDAFLNFPAERPATQVLFAFISAAICSAYLYAMPQNKQPVKPVVSKLYTILVTLVLLPTTYITYLTYQSMKGQMTLMRETNTDAKEPLESIATLLPPIPTISVTALPLASMKARYYMRDKRYDEALALLDKGAKDNPYIYYSEFLRAALYFSTDQIDSAYKYGKLSFYNWPRASNYYRNYVAILGKRKDTAEIKRAFATYVHYRNEPFSWNTYLMGMLQSKGRGDQQLLQMADSALKLFPADSNLLQRRKEIIGNLVGSNATAGSVTDQLIQANLLYQEGAKLFASKAYQAAAAKFAKAAALSPGNYAFFENAGICYYANNQFEKAIGYFDQAIALGTSTTGKSAYFKGVSLFSLGRKEEGCSFVRMADGQKYPDAAVFLRTNCN
jgi:O-antigen ligase/tetratricopeptide (TPR) repeat protein